MCEDLREWMRGDVRGKCEESESVWIELCLSRCVRKGYGSL